MREGGRDGRPTAFRTGAYQVWAVDRVTAIASSPVQFQVVTNAACAIVCAASGPATASVGQAASFLASASAQDCTGALTYAWTFGDGTTSSLRATSHSYAGAGTYAWVMTARADWGYMLLTNFLPSGGNGTFTLHAYAYDTQSQVTLLGSKTITCSNATAVKPFGTIDIPGQGETVSGVINNWGWVLTPQPASIATNGSTIWVYVDGLAMGHPTYNLYRSDIATLFPGYANTGGAVAYFVLDTTTLTNGVHTIAWSVTDNQGRSDGIGSRYFWVGN